MPTALLCALLQGGLFAAALHSDFTALNLEDLGTIKVPIVVGASKHAQRTIDAPSDVSVVTRDEIANFGYRTLGDLLRAARGFYVTSDRLYNYTGLRGVNRPGDYGGRVLLNVDGHRLNEPLYGSAFTSTEFLLDMDLVERVEIIRGPGSSLYGDNAFFTVVNVVTRRGRSLNGTELSAATGSRGSHTGRVSYGRLLANGVEVMLSGSLHRSSGHRRLHIPEFEDTNHAVAEDLDVTRSHSVFAAVSYRGLALSGGFVDREKQNPTAQYGSIFNDQRAVNRDARAFAELKFERKVGDSWSLESRVFYDRFRYGVTLAYDSPRLGAEVVNSDYGRAEWLGAEVITTKAIGLSHRIKVGGEVRDDFHPELTNYDVEPATTYAASLRRSSSTALYTQLESALRPDVILNAGIRYDHSERFGQTINPRAALNYAPWREGRLKLIYGRAFRAPNTYELDYLQPAFKTNPGLHAEKIRSGEIVFEQGFPGNVRATASAYVNDVTGLIGQTVDPTDGLNYFENLDGVRIHGIEVELEKRSPSGLLARLSYTYSEAVDSATRQRLDNSPRHLGKANLAAPLRYRGLFASMELQGMSRRTTVGGGDVGPVWLVNLTLHSHEIAPQLSLSFGIYNLLDRAYRDPVSADFAPIRALAQDGRSVQVKLGRRF